ncbi:Transcription factor HEX [Handroanthus impetiginosus]|uniref:Transcription factor HEX n=1 Tax=Handroanthus impetiginosus TaxID=429701 RepID=A0A2G9I609_9LAMI|nr:Transcription factor HEX [Handroanthus impetiginosus]
MELGLSLGDASKSFGFLKDNKIQQEPTKKKSSLDFCMDLGLSSSGGGNQEKTQKSDENGEENGEDDDDETSEGDGSDENQGEAPVQLNLLPLAPVPRQISSNLPWSSDNGSSENGSSGNMGLPAARGLDVNRLPGAAEEVSSANSVGSPFQMDFGVYRNTGNGNLQLGGNKRDFEATGNDAVEAERASSRASDDDENGLNTRKKLRLSKEQSAFLEESFKEHNTLNPKQKLALAKQLNLRPRQVEVWFQNRRARTKLKQTEVDCEYLKRCCETLTEENRRLHKELQELRALKTSNPFYMQLPATTLTMCPSCERVATASTAAGPPPATTNAAVTIAATTAKTTAIDATPKAIPFPLNRPRFYPFSQGPTHSNS